MNNTYQYSVSVYPIVFALSKKMNVQLLNVCILITVFVLSSHGVPIPSAKKVILDVPKLVNRFTKMITKSKQSIFNKSKDFKWGCGNKCDTQKRMLNVIKENREGNLNLIGTGEDKGLNGTSKITINKSRLSRRQIQNPAKHLRWSS